MKMRKWSLLMLAGLMFAWTVPAFAANAGSDDPSRVLRTTSGRGTFLEVTVLDTKGRVVPGARITATASDLTEVSAVTGPNGVAVLDGLPNESKGTVHATKNLRTVSWDLLLESGKENRLTVRYNVICERNALRVKLPTPARIEHVWQPVKYVGATLPVKGSKFEDNTQQLTFHPHGKGTITLAYARPWEWEGKPMPMVTDWHLSVYTVVKCPPKVKPAAAPAAE